jgi:hypothetical protein
VSNGTDETAPDDYHADEHDERVKPPPAGVEEVLG